MPQRRPRIGAPVDRRDVMAAIEGGMSQRKAAAKFNVAPGTVSAWCAKGPMPPEQAPAPEQAPQASEKKPVKPPTAAPAQEAPTARPRAREPMAPAFKRGLQAAVAMRIGWLARPESLHHKDSKSAALVVKLLAEAHPEALSLASEIETQATPEVFMDEIAAALRATETPGLTAIEGGKRATG